MADEFPSDADRAVLDVLVEENRVNPLLIRKRTDLDKGDVNTVLVRLSREGCARRVVRGLYEVTDRGREVARDE